MALDADTTPRHDSPSAPALEEREVAVLAEIAREGDAQVAFQGLRRRLEIHQESLARTLRRLEADGLLVKEDAGYRLTDAGAAALSGRGVAEGPRDVLPVVQALLPPHLDAAAVSAHLARRWFRGLRWFGQADGPGESALTWLTDPGNAKVTVRVGNGSLTVEVEMARDEPRRTFQATRAVLAAVAELYGLEPDHRDGPLAALAEARGVAA